ncbi:iron ABC transporter substrate-binding protein [Hornefia porci]|uniref:Iron ABC transporter substrate-binding protein n=1 Tax=Hornefia porci TaxID=2652292 RepID=A0A1Q9JF48_9FIRM|nr:ABC transporter substrate-binding protein [Hornefia porci]OLR54860.1 iron ABC transporter substrate-binding protein [Hornefia porci]
MRNRFRKGMILLLALVTATVLLLSGCGAKNSESASGTSGAPEISGLTYSKTMKLDYAKEFNVYYYKDGYRLIDIKDDAKYLIVPKGKKAPEKLSKKIKVLHEPVKNIYLAATASMALFSSMDALDNISMTSLKSGGWSFRSVRDAMNAGKIVYAGKYSEPDYELLLDKKCGLAIESTMIYHTPDVKEMIEDLKIPVMVDRSSYESNPLGRTEWIKLYGALTGHEKQAEAFFEKQEKKISALDDFRNTEKTVAFFYISTDGKAVVRSSKDYVPTMIEMAGGRYVFRKLTDSDGKTSVPMTIEKFYDTAADADYIVYNGSIDSTVRSMNDLIAKDPIMKKFKAVKNGQCYATGASMYQRTDIVGDMILDFHYLVTQKHLSEMKFLTKLK